MHKNFSKCSCVNSVFSHVKIIELMNKYSLVATMGSTDEGRYLIISLCDSKGIAVFNTFLRGEPLNTGSRNLTLKKLEKFLYRMVLID